METLVFFLKNLYAKLYKEYKNLSFFFISSIVSLAGSFFLTLAFANLLEKNAYGAYQYIISIVSVVAAFSLSGIGPAFVRAIGKKEYGFINYGQNRSIRWSLFPFIIALGVSAYYFIQSNALLAYAIIICVSITIITQYFSRFIHILNGLHLFFESNLIQSIQALAPIVILLPLLFFIDDPLLLSVVYFGSIAAATLGANLYIKTDSLLKRFLTSNINPDYNSANLKFAFHQSCINVINVGTANFDKIFLFQTLGAHQLASYVIAISIPNRIKAVIKQFEPYIFAKFANHSASAVRSELKYKFLAGTILTIPFFLLYVVFAQFFFNVFLSQYSSMATLSIIYSFSLLATASLIPYSALRAHADEPKFYFYTIASAIIQIVAIAIGVLLGGLMGAIIGKLVSPLINSVFAFVLALSVKEVKTSLTDTPEITS